MKKTLKLRYCGFWPGFAFEKRLFHQIISRHYEIDQKSEPDYVVCGDWGTDHTLYDRCVKILITFENATPNFNDYDYAVGFDHLEFGDRYVRVPYYAICTPEFMSLALRKSGPSPELLDRKFCSFVVSNAKAGHPLRRRFFERLCQYKKVDSGGRWLNNIGGAVKDKIEFCRGYKFNICFENSSHPGYVTEKLMHAYAAQTVPIYFGDPSVETDFNVGSMVRVRDESDVERAVEEVVRLDNDAEAYMQVVTANCLAQEDLSVFERRLEAFLLNIFEQPLSMAKRRCFYGYQKICRDHGLRVVAIDRWLRRRWNGIARLLKLA